MMARELEPGKRVSCYEIQSQIGQGTFSRVYAAIDVSDEQRPKRALLELVLRGTAEEQQLRLQTFQRSAAVLEKVSGPAIPKCYRFFQEGDRFYQVQELIEGTDLGQYVDAGNPPLSPDEAERILREVLNGLAQLHAAKIVHRDIKPSNLLRRHGDGSTVIVDFGSACDLSQAQAAATTMPQFSQGPGYTHIYTPGYAHPDQREGLVVANPQWDLYSLAVAIVALRLGSNPPWHQPWSLEGLGLSADARGLLGEMMKITGCPFVDARDALAYSPPIRDAIEPTPVARRRQRQQPTWAGLKPVQKWLVLFWGAGLLAAGITGGALYIGRDRLRLAYTACPNYTVSDAPTAPTSGFALRFRYPETSAPGDSVLEVSRDGKLLARANDAGIPGYIAIATLAQDIPFPPGLYELHLFVPESLPLEEEVMLATDAAVYLGETDPIEMSCAMAP